MKAPLGNCHMEVSMVFLIEESRSKDGGFSYYRSYGWEVHHTVEGTLEDRF